MQELQERMFHLAELTREMDRQPSGTEGEVVGLDLFDQRAVIVVGQHGGDRVLEVESFAENERSQRSAGEVANLAHVRRERVERDEFARVRAVEH